MQRATAGSSPAELTFCTVPLGAIVIVAVTFVLAAVLPLRSRHTRFTPVFRAATTRSRPWESRVRARAPRPPHRRGRSRALPKCLARCPRVPR